MSYWTGMKSKNVLSVIIVTLLLSTTGCVTLTQSKIPTLIESLNKHEFSEEERDTIGELLEYINELENGYI